MKTFETSYPLGRLPTLLILSIATLSTAITMLHSAASSHVPTTMTASTALLPSATSATLVQSGLDDYQPPNNGGPSTTGGSGTRWR